MVLRLAAALALVAVRFTAFLSTLDTCPLCTGPRHTAYSHTYTDALGGVNHLSFDAIAHEHVLSLDGNDQVVSVVCHDEESMLIELADVRALESWTPGTILAGTLEAWQCADRSGHPHPFTRELRRVARLEVNGVAARVEDIAFSELPPGEALGALVVFETQEAGAHACFERVELAYHRTPGPFEEDLKKAAAGNATLRRELGLWDWGSSVVSSVSSAVSTATNFVASGGSWGGQQSYDYSLINWNYDVENRQSAGVNTPLLGDAIVCKDCYAYLGANLKVAFSATWGTLNSMEISAQAAAILGLDIDVALPSPLNSKSTICVWPGSDCRFSNLPTISFVIGAVPIKIYSKTRLFVATQASAQVTGQITGPGLWYDNSIIVGIKYSPNAGWAIINERTMTMNQRSPSFNIQGNAYFRASPILEIVFSLWNAWDIGLKLGPWISLNADFAAASNGACPSGSFALTMQAGLDAVITLNEPRIQINAFGTSFSLSVPGLGAYFPISYPISVTPAFRFNVAGSSGCTSGVSMSADDSYYYRRLEGSPRALQAPITYAWTESNWTQCSVDCGMGTQTRAVRCVGSDGSLAASTACSGTAPAGTQQCEPTCPYYFGSGIFNMSLAPILTDEITFGQSIVEGTKVVWRFQMSSTFNGLSMEMLVTNFGYPKLRVISSGMPYTKRDQSAINYAPATITATAADDGVLPTDILNVSVTSAPVVSPVDFLSNPGFASFTLKLRPFFALEPSRAVPGALTAGQRRFYRYYPSPGAAGLSLDVLPTSGLVEMYVNPISAGWPSTASSNWSTVTAQPGFKSVIIQDTSFEADYYLILVVALSDAVFTIHAADVKVLTNGNIDFGSTSTSGLAYYRFDLLDTDTFFSIALESLSGDADLYISRLPFTARPYFDMANGGDFVCPTCIRESVYPGYKMDVISLSSLDPRWATSYWIVVDGFYASNFRISAQSFESMDQGVSIRRFQQPDSMSYFRGSDANTANQNDDIGLSFQAKAVPILGTPGSLNIIAGAADKFFPAVRNGYNGLVSPVVTSGSSSSVAGAYLPGTTVARMMLMGIQTGFHGVNVLQQPVFGTPGAAGRRRALRESAAPAADTNGLPAMKGVGQNRPFANIFASYDAWNASTQDRPHRQTKAAAPPAPFDASYYLGTLRDAATAAAASSTQQLEQQQQRRNERLGRNLAASLADPVLFFAPPPTSPVFVPVDRFAGGDWSPVANCALNSLYTSSSSCTRQSGQPTDNIYLRVRVPARVAISVSVVAAARAGSSSLDAPYTILLQANAPPTAQSNFASATGSSGTFRVSNCAYTAAPYFLAVSTQNQGALAPLFDFYIEGSSADKLVCPNYVWASAAWNTCNAPCGAGQQTRAVWCQDASSGLVYDSSFCNPNNMPASILPCDVGACAWVLSEWQDCPVPCGGGVTNAPLSCVNGGGFGVQQINGQCDSSQTPATSKTCNTQACPTYLWLADPWTACSASCGGGVRTRSVSCAKSLGSGSFTKDQADANCPSIKPAEKEVCNSIACASTVFDAVYYDTRALLTGQPRTDLIPSGGRSFFTYSRPTAAAMGVCLVVTPASPLASDCTTASEKRAASCINSLNACYQNAIANATATSISAGETPVFYEPIINWAPGTPEVRAGGYVTPPGGCSCFASAIACVAENKCSDDVQQAVDTLSDYCYYYTQRCYVEGPGAIGTCTKPDPATLNAKVASPQLRVYVSPLNTRTPSANPFLPPIDSSLAMWGGSSMLSTGQQRLVVTDGYGDASADTIIIGIYAPNASASATITATALSSHPVSFSGSLTAATVSAAAIRAGGLTLVIELSCDAFVDPSVNLADLPFIANASAASLGNLVSPNLMALGLIAATSSAAGFNRVVRPYLLSPSTPVFGAFSFGMTRLTITLPSIPAYFPTTNEKIGVAIPSALLRSGVTTPVEGLTISVVADNQDCLMSDWSAWSPCSTTCSSGLQTRTRTELTSSAGLAAACPASAETRTCNTCDACSTVTVANGGLCALGACACAPGFSGRDCSTPAPLSSAYFWLSGPWSACMLQCGAGGRQSRTSTCMVASGGAVSVAPPSALGAAPPCAALPKPSASRACNAVECTETRVALSLALNVSAADAAAAIGSDSVFDALAGAVAAELAGALAVSVTRIVINTIVPATLAPAGDGMTQTASLAPGSVLSISAFLLPPSFVTSSAAGALVGGTNADVLSAMQSMALQGGGALYTQGTYVPSIFWNASSWAVVSGIRGDTSATGSFVGIASSARSAPTGGLTAPGEGESTVAGGGASSTVVAWSSAVIGVVVGLAIIAIGVGVLVVVILRRNSANKTPLLSTTARNPTVQVVQTPSSSSAAAAADALATSNPVRVVVSKRLSLSPAVGEAATSAAPAPNNAKSSALPESSVSRSSTAISSASSDDAKTISFAPQARSQQSVPPGGPGVQEDSW